MRIMMIGRCSAHRRNGKCPAAHTASEAAPSSFVHDDHPTFLGLLVYPLGSRNVGALEAVLRSISDQLYLTGRRGKDAAVTRFRSFGFVRRRNESFWLLVVKHFTTKLTVATRTIIGQ
jgi:hypothetical protein